MLVTDGSLLCRDCTDASAQIDQRLASMQLEGPVFRACYSKQVEFVGVPS